MLADKLLDNNVISVLVSDTDPRRAHAQERLQASAPSRILLPVIAVAEIECGMAMANNPAAEPQRQRLRSFFNRYQILPFNEHTIQPYSLLRAKLWRMCGTPKGSGRRYNQQLPEDLCDPVSGNQLGIDERDLQIISIALTYSLIFATFDRNDGMKRIEAAAAELERDGELNHLEVEDWTPPVALTASAPSP